ncbi:hypothetical protein BK785_09550 [Bacillus thuringiensis serovar bolivia]|nr:hypothetical protein [Bacillus thuringiensis]OUA60394.1 hypothetical protein BK785_09550 [Bacillus thuringiensis serovar bolivia]OUA80033.1 hypothetical protein BK787_03525 [Bacillus thuringiensis serovar pahangi]
MDIYSLLNGTGFLNVNKALARKTSLNASAVFGQVLSSYQDFKKKGMLTIRDGKSWFFLTEKTIEEETTLKKEAQAAAIKLLVQEEYIVVKRFGVPAKRHFYITSKIFLELVQDNEELREALIQQGFSDAQTQKDNMHTTSYVKNTQLDEGNSHNLSAENHTAIKKKKEKEKKKKEKDNKSITHNKRKSRDEIVSEVKELYDELIDDITYKLVVQRVIDAKPRRFRDYLKKAVETEIKNIQSEKAKKTTKTEMVPDWVGKEDNESGTAEKDVQAPENLDDERKRLEEILKKYKKD